MSKFQGNRLNYREEGVTDRKSMWDAIENRNSRAAKVSAFSYIKNPKRELFIM